MNLTMLQKLPDQRPPNPVALKELRAWLGRRLPGDLEEMLAVCDGWTGYWNAEGFLDLWGAVSIRANHEAYQVGKYAPNLLLIGSRGCGEALGYDLATGSENIFHVPFVGLSRERMVHWANSLEDYLAALGPPAPLPTAVNEIEIVELKPVLFGGDPVGANNKARLTRTKHIEFVSFWNKLVTDVRQSGR